MFNKSVHTIIPNIMKLSVYSDLMFFIKYKWRDLGLFTYF